MSPYQQLVNSLSDADISKLAHGQAVIACDDRGYRLVGGASSLFMGEADAGLDREKLMGMEQQVLEQLYSQRPLCRVEFDYQAGALLSAHGAAQFCRHDGNPGNWALMIDDWRLVAVGLGDVRSQYGYFCEAEGVVDEAQAETLLLRWLASGQAYEDYLGKTHCRYCL